MPSSREESITVQSYIRPADSVRRLLLSPGVPLSPAAWKTCVDQVTKAVRRNMCRGGVQQSYVIKKLHSPSLEYFTQTHENVAPSLQMLSSAQLKNELQKLEVSDTTGTVADLRNRLHMHQTLAHTLAGMSDDDMASHLDRLDLTSRYTLTRAEKTGLTQKGDDRASALKCRAEFTKLVRQLVNAPPLSNPTINALEPRDALEELKSRKPLKLITPDSTLQRQKTLRQAMALRQTMLDDTTQRHVRDSTKQHRDTAIDVVFHLTRKSYQTRKHSATAILHGFAICKLVQHNKQTGVYVDVLCANPGHGGALLEHIEQFAQTHRLAFITLSATPAAMSFYRRFKYQHWAISSGHDGDTYAEPPHITDMADKIFSQKLNMPFAENLDKAEINKMQLNTLIAELKARRVKPTASKKKGQTYEKKTLCDQLEKAVGLERLAEFRKRHLVHSGPHTLFSIEKTMDNSTKEFDNMLERFVKEGYSTACPIPTPEQMETTDCKDDGFPMFKAIPLLRKSRPRATKKNATNRKRN
jgi:hypothetical protein